MPVSKTQLDIDTAAGQRNVKKLGQTIRDAFSPNSAKELKTVTRDLERQFASAAKAQASILKQLDGVKKGTKAYKELREQLKGVKEQGDLAAKTISQLNSAQQRLIRESKSRGGAAFGLGAAQGLGVAQYLPSGPGAGARLGGAMVGGAMRRGAGMAAAPFTTPGIGGVAQGLAGIPVVGGFAAGALQSAAASYQAAVGFDRAQQQNLYFANANRGRDLGVGANPEYVAAQTNLQDLEARRTGILNRQGQLQTERRQLLRGDTSSEAVRNRRRMANQLGAMASLTGGVDLGGRRAAPNVHQIEQRAIRQEIKDNKDRLMEANRAIDTAKERAKGIAKTVNRGKASGLGSLNLATDLGIGPMQAEAMKGEMFGARGGVFDRSAFVESAAAKIRYGVGMGAAGQFGRMGMAGGGGTNMGSLASVLQGAFVQGLRGSQIPEYLQTLVGLGQQSEKQGIKLDATAFQDMSVRLRGAGIQGLQGQRIAGGLVGAAQGLSGKGAQSPMDVLMMRAAGFEPGQGLEGYARAMGRLESPDQQLLGNILQQVTQGTEGFGGAGRALLTKRALGRIGVQVGMGQAGKIISGFGQGQMPDITAMQAEQAAMGDTAGMVKGARGMVPGRLKTAAGLEVQRIGVGRGSGWVAEFESNSIKTGQIMNRFGTQLGNLSKAVDSALVTFDSLAKLGAEKGFLATVKNLLQLTSGE
jgi:hypothetical protein